MKFFGGNVSISIIFILELPLTARARVYNGGKGKVSKNSSLIPKMKVLVKRKKKEEERKKERKGNIREIYVSRPRNAPINGLT